jgi:outer membrane protein insertion porin family
MLKKIILTFIFLLFISPVLANDIEPVTLHQVQDIHIKIPGGTSVRQEKLRSLAQRMIQVKKGEPLSSQALADTIELLKQTSQFSSIDVPDPQPVNDTINISFILTPAQQIRKITVKGAFPVFKDDVIDETDYTVGKSYHPNTLEKNIQAIKELLVKNGYTDPDVKIDLEPVDDLELSILIQIEKGAPLKVSQIKFSGNNRISDTRLRMQMASYKFPLIFWIRGKRFEQENLDKDMKKLLSFYRGKKFYDAVITYQIERDQNNKLTLNINIDEGPEYRLTFLGNTEFAGYKLKKELILSQKGNGNDFGLKKSVKNIRQKYRNAGYQDCKVSYTGQLVVESGKTYKNVTIQINENTRYIVRSSKFQGSSTFEADVLKQEILTLKKALFYDGQFVKSKFKEDSIAVEDFYGSHGFVDTKVTSHIKWDQDTDEQINYGDAVFDVTEGYQKMITAVNFLGLTPEFEARINPLMKTIPDTPLIVPLVQKDRQTILSFLAEEGYIYAEVEARVNPGMDKTACSMEFTIVQGAQISVGGVWTFGNQRTKDTVLLRHNSIQPDEPVSLNQFVDLQKEIRNINCIERVDFKVLGTKEKLDQLYFLADIEEKKPYYLETSLGYNTAKDGYLAVSVGDNNFLGMNRELYLDTEISGVGYDATLGINEFDFLSQYILARFSIYASEEELKNQTFGSRKYGSELSFEKKLTKYLKVDTNFGFESREQYQIGGTQANNTDIFATRGIVEVTPFVTWDSVNSFVKPTRGFYFNVSAGYNKDVLEDLDHFIKYKAKAKYYHQLFPRLVMAFQGMVGYIQNFADDSDLPDDQLFFLGGIADVRGFDENELLIDGFKNPVGGKTQILGSVEARIDLGMNFEIPLFIDAGSIRETNVPGSNEDFKYSVGTGIRYMTPVGPVGLLYGYKLNPEDDEDTGRFHFSIGYTF